MHKSETEEGNERETRKTAVQSSRRKNKVDIKVNGSKDVELLS
jgi:hypothetical protein